MSPGYRAKVIMRDDSRRSVRFCQEYSLAAKTPTIVKLVMEVWKLNVL